jgi:hypothetical protein
VRNLALGGIRVEHGLQGEWLVKFAPDFLAENVRVWKGLDDRKDPLFPNILAKRTDVSAVANARFIGCRWEADITTNAAHDVSYINCTIAGKAHDEWTRRVYHVNSEISTFCTAHYGASQVNLLNCRLRRMTQTGAGGFALGGQGQHTLLNCRFDSGTTHPCYLSGGRNSVAHLRGDAPLIISGGTGNALHDLTVPNVILTGDSTGVVVPPVNSPAGLQIDTPANWVVVPDKLKQVNGRLAYGTSTPGAELSVVGSVSRNQVGVHVQNTHGEGYSVLRLGTDSGAPSQGFTAHYFNASWLSPTPAYAAGGATLSAFGSAGLTLHTDTAGAPIRFFTGGQHNERLRIADDGVRFLGNVGFYGAAPIAKPTITGSRGGNAALESLLIELAKLGLINNSTSASSQDEAWEPGKMNVPSATGSLEAVAE